MIPSNSLAENVLDGIVGGVPVPETVCCRYTICTPFGCRYVYARMARPRCRRLRGEVVASRLCDLYDTIAPGRQ